MNEIVVIVVERSEGTFLLHRRSSSRSTYPELHGLGAGGKIEHGEAPLDAALRELREETGIVDHPLTAVTSFPFIDRDVAHRVHVFHGIVDEIIHWDSREWASIAWLARGDIDRLSNDGLLCPDTVVVWSSFCDWRWPAASKGGETEGSVRGG